MLTNPWRLKRNNSVKVSVRWPSPKDAAVQEHWVMEKALWNSGWCSILIMTNRQPFLWLWFKWGWREREKGEVRSSLWSVSIHPHLGVDSVLIRHFGSMCVHVKPRYFHSDLCIRILHFQKCLEFRLLSPVGQVHIQGMVCWRLKLPSFVAVWVIALWDPVARIVILASPNERIGKEALEVRI